MTDFDLHYFSERILAETDQDAPRVTFGEVGHLIALASRALKAEYELKQLRKLEHATLCAIAAASGGEVSFQKGDLLRAEAMKLTRWEDQFNDTLHFRVSRP